MKFSPLAHRQLIEISGKDRYDFLQGLITVDIKKLTSQNALWAGLLSPQGKALFDFFIYDISDDTAFLIDIDRSQAENFIAHLQKYKLRSKVTITKNTDLHVVAAWDCDGFSYDGFMFKDPRADIMGLRIVATLVQKAKLTDTYRENHVDITDYTALRIANQIVDPAQDMQDIEYYWPEINAEALNGIDYQKGCYIGQEINARLKHKAQLKRQVILVYVMGNPKTPIIMETDAKEIGTLICFDDQSHQGLAYVRLDRWDQAIETLRSVTAGDTIIKKVTH